MQLNSAPLNAVSLNSAPLNAVSLNSSAVVPPVVEEGEERHIGSFVFEGDADCFRVRIIDTALHEVSYAAEAYPRHKLTADEMVHPEMVYETDAAEPLHVVGVVERRAPVVSLLETGGVASISHLVRGLALRHRPAVHTLRFEGSADLRHYTKGEDIDAHTFWRLP